MKVEHIEIKNFKAIEAESITTNGRNVYVVGSNGAGKSSFIDAVFKILTGKDLPGKLTRDGAPKGAVKLDLGELVVEADFNAKKEKVQLTVSSPDGAVYKTPRTMLDEKVGVIDFDLNAFFALTPKKKVDFIKQISGIDFSDLDERYKELFDERTFINRKVKELAAICDNSLVKSSAKEKIDLAAIQQKLEQAQVYNQKHAEVVTRQQQRVERYSALQQQIEALQKEQSEVAALCDQASAWLGQNQALDTAPIKAEFDFAIQHNAEVDKTAAAAAKLEEYNQAVAQQEHLNNALAEVEQAKKDAIASAQLPVPGLTFDDTQLYLNGLPFEPNQINTAQLIIAGLQINLALMKEVRIARFDGSLLDNKSLAEVEAWAAANDLQLFVEMVSRDAKGMQVVVQEAAGEEVLA
ncbi:ATP-binding protein [Pontibacter mangrovi]|uniref:Endonuclease GajA/Old nuclease/RecF-like AAA domain-containing protein n=1 Tax=Pontibacter mangrovi TaxID=2589816 RepID=A0A501W6N9_9BACT|nr:ATP-binding protein [Pontibacter mangrovi]TPE44958.1 hypothetical protein FJM65_08050 [Pontibacter mangrovi]